MRDIRTRTPTKQTASRTADLSQLLAQRVSAATSAMTVEIGGQADEEWTRFKRRD
jgi:hypothetical protein